MSKMDDITTEMAEYICDNLCHYPKTVQSQDELNNICCECAIAGYIRDILHTYNEINDFEKTQCAKLLAKITEIKKIAEGASKND